MTDRKSCEVCGERAAFAQLTVIEGRVIEDRVCDECWADMLEIAEGVNAMNGEGA